MSETFIVQISELDLVCLCLAMLQKADESAPVSPSTRRNVVTIIDDEPPPSSVGGSCCGGSWVGTTEGGLICDDISVVRVGINSPTADPTFLLLLFSLIDQLRHSMRARADSSSCCIYSERTVRLLWSTEVNRGGERYALCAVKIIFWGISCVFMAKILQSIFFSVVFVVCKPIIFRAFKITIVKIKFWFVATV